MQRRMDECKMHACIDECKMHACTTTKQDQQLCGRVQPKVLHPVPLLRRSVPLLAISIATHHHNITMTTCNITMTTCNITMTTGMACLYCISLVAASWLVQPKGSATDHHRMFVSSSPQSLLHDCHLPPKLLHRHYFVTHLST